LYVESLVENSVRLKSANRNTHMSIRFRGVVDFVRRVARRVYSTNRNTHMSIAIGGVVDFVRTNSTAPPIAILI